MGIRKCGIYASQALVTKYSPDYAAINMAMTGAGSMLISGI